MKHKNILSFTLIFASIFIALFIILLNVKILVSDQNFYHNEFKKYGVYENLRNYDIEEINKETIDFILNKKNLLPANFFLDREIAHLNDVKKIVEKGQILFLFSIAIILFFVIFLLLLFKNVEKAVFYFSLSAIIGCIAILLFSFFFFLSIKFNFNLSFDKFHTTFFERDSYIFNPENEKIVLLYPEGLFYDAGRQIILNSFLFSFISMILSLVLIIKLKKNKLMRLFTV